MDWRLIRSGARSLLRGRLPLLLFVVLLVGALIGTAAAADHRFRPAASQNNPSALRTVVLLPISPRGEARPLLGRSLDEIRRWPHVTTVLGTGRYGVTATDSRWCDPNNGCIPWYVTERFAAIQPPLVAGREPQAADEVLLPAQPGGPDLAGRLGQSFEIEYTFLVGENTGEPRRRKVTLVGLFEPRPSALDGNDPAYGSHALVTELAAASVGKTTQSFDPASYPYPQAYVEVDTVESVDAVVTRLSDAGYATNSVSSLSGATSDALMLLRLLVWALAIVALGVCVGLGAMIGASALARRSTEVGILRAVGWQRSRVTRVLLGELALVGMCVGVVAAVVGIVAAVVLASRPGVAGGGLTAVGQLWPWWLAAVVGVPASLCLGALPGVVRLTRMPPDAALREL